MWGKHFSLERRLVSYVGMGLLLFSLIAGAVSYWLAYQNQLDAEQAFHRQLLRTVQAQAEVAVFARNATIAQDVIGGLLSNPTVRGVRITSTEGFVEEQGRQPELDYAGAARFPLFSPVDGHQKVGTLFLLQDDARIASLAARSAFTLTAWLLFQIVIAAGLLFAVSRAVMGKPIAALAAAVSYIRPGDGRRVPVAPAHANDEIGMLANHTNALIGAAEAAMAESNRATQLAEFSNHAKSDFLALMSHEIRTPLSAVIGILELALRDATLHKRTREQIDHGIINARSLLKIINDLLDFSKIEGGRLSLENIDFALVQCIEEAVDVFQHGAANANVRIVSDIAADVPAFARGDPTRLRQILINLVGNAVKFTERGEVVVGAFAVTGPDGRRQVEISVRDTGIGIAAEALPRLFHKFEQSDISMARRFGGTGLGLAICRQLVELMGGTIDVHSTEGVGTIFHFVLPLAEGNRPAPTAARERLRHSHSLRVLVAEDFLTNQIIIQSILEDMGHVVDIVDNGCFAVEAVSRKAYDLVLMDGRMPEMDGLAATLLIRSGGTAEFPALEADLPIVALTANVGEADRQRYLAAGMQDVLIKPIDEAALHNIVEQVIAARLAKGVTLAPQSAAPAAPNGARSTAELDAFFGVAPPAGPTLLDRARAAFVGERERRQKVLADAVLNRDGTQAALILHSLRGGAAYLGMDELQQICTELELAADTGAWEKIDAALPHLRDLLDKY